jgi:serine/threonine protein kinase
MILRKPYSHKIDIWGLGILLFEMIEGRAPFEGHTQEEVLDRMKKPIYFSKNFTAEEIDLVHKILKVDPN